MTYSDSSKPRYGGSLDEVASLLSKASVLPCDRSDPEQKEVWRAFEERRDFDLRRLNLRLPKKEE